MNNINTRFFIFFTAILGCSSSIFLHAVKQKNLKKRKKTLKIFCKWAPFREMKRPYGTRKSLWVVANLDVEGKSFRLCKGDESRSARLDDPRSFGYTHETIESILEKAVNKFEESGCTADATIKYINGKFTLKKLP